MLAGIPPSLGYDILTSPGESSANGMLKTKSSIASSPSAQALFIEFKPLKAVKGVNFIRSKSSDIAFHT